jgi:hypothetical protein
LLSTAQTSQTSRWELFRHEGTQISFRHRFTQIPFQFDKIICANLWNLWLIILRENSWRKFCAVCALCAVWKKHFLTSTMLRLEPYKTRASRYECPACGHKHVFVRYVDESGQHLASEVGRCNRESKCGYHLKPKEYFAAHASYTATPKSICSKLPKSPVVLREILMRYLENSRRAAEQNAFVRFLLCRYDRAQVLQTCDQYFLGDYEGFTTFWRVDERGHINTAKLMRYDAATGQRVKDSTGTHWLHAKLKQRGVLPESFEYRRSDFGAHLLAQEPRVIAMVEAEKTAVIASLELPNYTWLACGGKSQLSVTKLARYARQRIVLFPDGDGFAQWSQIADKACAQGLDVIVSDLLETEYTDEQKAAGWDLADYLLASEEVVAVASQPLSHFGLPSAPIHSINYNGALGVGNCRQCGDPLNRAGECELCPCTLPF